ncbi:hypothetical protein, partial [Saccharophagus degradans]
SNTVAGGGVFAGTIDVSDNTAKLEIRTEVINDSKQTSKIELVTTLEDTNFNLLKKTTKKLTLRAGKSKQMKQLLTVNDVQFWHPDNP